MDRRLYPRAIVDRRKQDVYVPNERRNRVQPGDISATESTSTVFQDFPTSATDNFYDSTPSTDSDSGGMEGGGGSFDGGGASGDY